MKQISLHIAIAFFGLFIGSCQKELPNQPKGNQTPMTRLWVSSDTLLNETLSRQNLHFYGEDPDGFVKGFLVAVSDSNQLFSQIPNPDVLTYSWVRKNDTTVSIPLRAKRSKFTIVVRSVDNTFSLDTLPEHSSVKGFPNPYWDRDENGIFSAGDIQLTSMNGAVDPVGAIQIFPIINTPPNVQFAVISPDNPVTIEQPETTYTAASFSWVGTDNDGHNTLKSYRLALNDTSDASAWFELPSSASTKKSGEADTVKIMLYVKRADSDLALSATDAEVYTGTFGNLQFRGKIKNLRLNAQNVLYLKVKDLADDSSATIRMPSVSSKKWYVKRPKSRMLVVADFGSASSKISTLNFYRDILSQNSPKNPQGISVMNDQLKNFDVFDRSHFTNSNFYNPTFIKTLQLFDVVLWFTDVSPSITAAQTGLFYYTNTLNTERNTYGKVIFTTQYQQDPSYAELRAYNDFAPLDSTTSDSAYTYNRLHVKNVITILDSVKVKKDSVNFRDSLFIKKDSVLSVNVKVLPQAAGYPVLFTDSVTTGNITLSPSGVHTAFFKRLYKRTDAQYIYRMDSSRAYRRNNQGVLLVDENYRPKLEYKQNMDIGIIDNQKRFVMFGLPLHLLNGWEHNLPSLFKKIIEGEFGLQ